MARRKRDIAVIVLKCAIIGLGAVKQQAVFGAEMTISRKEATGAIKGAAGSNMRRRLWDAQLGEGGPAPIFPLVLLQPDLVASASQAVGGGYVLMAQADMPAELRTIVQETKNADTPAEPQAVIQEVKSEASLSSSKQRRRKPKMAGVPAGSQMAAQETKESELPVAQGAKESGPQVAAQETEETDMSDKSPAATQKTRNAGAPAEPQVEGKGAGVRGAGKKRYGMAPVLWGARVTEAAGWEHHSQTYHGAAGYNTQGTTTSSNLVHTQTVEAHAKTYVIQPYVAQLGGNVGVVSSRSGVSGVGMTSGGRTNRLFGDGSLSLFSQSRFPFAMSLGVSNNRDSEGVQILDTVIRYLELEQSYKALGSSATYDVNYGRGTSTVSGMASSSSNPFATETHSLWRGRYANITDEHRIDAGITFNDRLTSPIHNENRRADSLVASDTYLPADSLLSLRSFAIFNSLTDNSTINNFRTRNLQFNSTARWQPESEDIPLFVDGNVQLFNMSTTNQGIASLFRSLGGTANGRYLFSKNLTGYATGSVTSTTTNGRRNLVTIESGRATYTSDVARVWKNSTYSWSANGGVSNQTGSDADRNVSAGVGHRLSVPYPFDLFGKKWQMGSDIHQSLGANLSRVSGRSITLGNGGSISLSSLLATARPNKEQLGGYGTAEGAVNTTAILSANDTRTVGGKNPSHTRTYSLALNLREASKSVYSRYGIEAEATLGATQGTAGTDVFGVATAKYTYKKTRVFDVRGLDYVGSLKISTGLNSRVFDVNARNPKFPWFLDQRLTYRIGQNEMLLRSLVSDEYGVKNASLWLLFRAWRTIGN